MEGKKVVIIGGGIAGSLLARRLQLHAHVTLIDVKQYFRIPWAMMRAMVDPSFAQRSIINYSEFLTEVRLITSAAVGVTETEVITDSGYRATYDYLVIATGHEDASPMTRDERIYQCHEAFEKISDANLILIAGGGPSGVELAGEIATQLPDKKVVLVHRGSRLLEFIGLKASKKALDWLISKNVEVILDQSLNLAALKKGIVETSNGETFIADCYFDCTGKPIGSKWMAETILSNSLDMQGRLVVDMNMRVKGYKNIFAIGDVTDVPEIKQGFYAMKHSEVAAKNIRLLIEGGKECKMATYRPGRPMAFVALGKREAVGQIFCFTFSGRLAGLVKSSDLLVERTRRIYGL